MQTKPFVFEDLKLGLPVINRSGEVLRVSYIRSDPVTGYAFTARDRDGDSWFTREGLKNENGKHTSMDIVGIVVTEAVC